MNKGSPEREDARFHILAEVSQQITSILGIIQITNDSSYDAILLRPKLGAEYDVSER